MTSELLPQTPTGAFPTADAMSSVAYWQRLLPEFNISEHPFNSQKSEHRFTTEQAGQLSRQIKKEGYFRSDPIIPSAEFKPLAQAIARLDHTRNLPVFVAIYDEFWQFLHSLRNTLTPILGESYRLTPDFWVWHVPPNDSGRGWKLHRDSALGRPFDKHARIREDGSPRLCTVWIPLTNATTDNSCIYVLPFPHDPAMQSFMRKESLDKIQQASQRTDLTNIRALPAQAGSVLGWTPYIAHWGSQSTEWATHARVSIGIYYEAVDAPKAGRPSYPERFQYIDHHDTDYCVSFEDRLRIIATILSTYINNGQMVNEPNFAPSANDFCQRWQHTKK